MEPPPPENTKDGEITGQITNIPQEIGGRTFTLDDFSTTIITLTPLAQEAGTYHITDSAVKTATITGNTYTISGVSAGTYRLTAEDPTGLYDYVDNRFEFNGKAPAKNINLAVFEGLKMTVRIPASSPAFILPVKQNLGNSPMLQDPGVVVDLAVDWGDGGESALTKKPNGYEDPAFTHRYAAPRDYTIRIKGKCWGTEPNGSRTFDYKGKFGMSFTRIGEGNGEQAGHSGPITLPVEGFALDENKDKLIKLAGNITALTKPDAKNGDAYYYAFESCNKLEDISGLAFTDTGASGENFMYGIFQSCAALTTMPADFVPRGLTIEANFLYESFLNDKKLAAIGPRFLPDTLAATGKDFLYRTFSGCTKLTEVPAAFLPPSLAATGDGFLYGTFQSSGIAAIPAAFVPASLHTVGANFLADTFAGCTKLKTLPEDFLPSSLTTVGTGFLSNTFSGCSALASADITVPASLTTAPSGFMQRTFYDCSRLKTVALLVSASPSGTFMPETFTGVARVISPKLTLRIHNNTVLDLDTAAAGLLDTNVAAVEVPTTLVDSYKAHAKWGGGPISQDKIIAIQAIQG